MWKGKWCQFQSIHLNYFSAAAFPLFTQDSIDLKTDLNRDNIIPVSVQVYYGNIIW
jgi:hypothetical protein